MVGRADDHGVEPLLLDQAAEVVEGLGLGEPGGGRLEQAVVDVADGDDVLPLDPFDVAQGPARGADDPDVQLLVRARVAARRQRRGQAEGGGPSEEIAAVPGMSQSFDLRSDRWGGPAKVRPRAYRNGSPKPRTDPPKMAAVGFVPRRRWVPSVRLRVGDPGRIARRSKAASPIVAPGLFDPPTPRNQAQAPANLRRKGHFPALGACGGHRRGREAPRRVSSSLGTRAIRPGGCRASAASSRDGPRPSGASDPGGWRGSGGCRPAGRAPGPPRASGRRAGGCPGTARR